MIRRPLIPLHKKAAAAALLAVSLAALLLLALPASAATGTAKAKPKPHGKPAPFGSVEFDISETLLAATTDTSEAPMPKVNPSKISDAYDCTCKPGAKSFHVEQDVFVPAEIVVHQGDTVALRIFDVEGHHVITLYDPTGATVFSKFKTYAGNEYLKVFKANQLGYYRLDCETHDPTMRMEILVLRKGA